MQVFYFLLSLFFVTACNDISFSSRDSLDHFRIIALQVSPPEPTYNDVIQLHAFTFDPTIFESRSLQSIEYHWTICFLTLGAAARYQCADPRLAISIDSESPDITIDLSSNGYDIWNLYQIFQSQIEELAASSGISADFNSGLPMSVTLRSVFNDASEDSIVTPISVFQETHVSHSNPRISEIALSTDMLYVNEQIEVECRLSEVPDLTSEELYRYAWYASAGAWDYTVRAGSNRTNTLTLPPFPGDMLIMLAVRDGHGGVDVAEKRITVLERE